MGVYWLVELSPDLPLAEAYFPRSCRIFMVRSEYFGKRGTPLTDDRGSSA
jgi:hypothetical protein